MNVSETLNVSHAKYPFCNTLKHSINYPSRERKPLNTDQIILNETWPLT